ncbi:MAG: amino acid ABC transporter ATP-binding protein [Pseudomonadota bacterium]|nr:amino acid ABC transporter ATP-binding protein [Pseudomonadota bacterium]
MKPFLTINQVSLTLQDKKILDKISFDILPGSCTVIIGPSGSGKSSLLRSINLLNKYDQGTISLDGQNIKDITTMTLRKKIGMVFQQYNLFDHMTVIENCTLALKHVLNLGQIEADKIAMTYLEKVKMNEFSNEYPRQLSGGQQQRVAIARAMCLQPAVLLLDEPTAALDPEMSFEVLEVIKSLAQEGVTMIYVTHEINLARNLADQVVFLEEGRLVACGNVNELLIKPKNTRIKRFINQVEYHHLYSQG